jgi:hypothetical protein
MAFHYINAPTFLEWAERSEPIGRPTYEDNQCVDVKL